MKNEAIGCVAEADAETAAAPPPWWPSRYCPDDEAGALNEVSPAGVVPAHGSYATVACSTWLTCSTST